VSGGTLAVGGVTGGTNFANGRFSLAGGQTLIGTGAVTGAMDVRSTAAVSPGAGGLNSVGTLTTAPVSFQSGGIYRVDLNSFTTGTHTPGTDNDFLSIAGALTLANGFAVNVNKLIGGPTPTDHTTRTYTIATASGGVTLGTYTINPTGFAAGDQFALSVSGNNLVLSYTPVPEPMATLGIFAVGLGTIYGLRRYRRRGQLAITV
jgi:hypothetical protein